MSELTWGHEPVLREEVLQWLGAPLTGLVVDGTVGAGGHAEALLDASPAARLIGVDRDPLAVATARLRLERFGARATVLQGCFGDLGALLSAPELALGSGAGAVLVDLGLSSLQLADRSRGFSFSADGPLDMRMDPTVGAPAWQRLAELGTAEIAAILRQYGEVVGAQRMARAMAAELAAGRVTTSAQLAALALRVLGRGRRERIHPATQVFQAIRIWVNDELGELESFLRVVPTLLAPGGRVAIVSFHSLEDRAVKHGLRAWQQGPPTARPDRYGPPPPVFDPILRVLTRRSVQPGAAEVARNPRSRSARLRVAERTAVGLPRPAPGGEA